MNSLKAFYADIYPVVPYLGRWVIDYSVELAAGVGRLLQTVLGNQTKLTWLSVLRRSAVLVLYHPVQLILTVSSLVLNAVASLLNNTILRSPERALSTNEIQYLQAIFSDNLDYEKIRIQFGGVKALLKVSPQAVGNDIFVREWWGSRIYYDDLSLSDAGLRLLGHEACHVWQFQHSGASYIGASLITQFADFLGRTLGLHFSDGYNIEPALRNHQVYRNCNVEQQAVIAESIGASCAADNSTMPSKAMFCKVSGLHLNDEEFAGVVDAHTWLQKTPVASFAGW